MALRLKNPQKRLGPYSFFVCVMAIELIAILSVDMYVPALPSMQTSFQVSVSYLNLTMFAFFFVSAFATFFAGPLSDRFGRKPVLLTGTVLFSASALLCCIAPSVEVLVFGRVLQGIGLGCIQTVATACVQDAYSPESVQFAMTALQSLVIIGPVFAPFLGTFILLFTDWRGIFALLSVLGALSILSSCLLSETHVVSSSAKQQFSSVMKKIFSDIALLVRKKSFTSLALIMACAGMPFFAYIAVVSYILIDFFAMNYMEYSVVYAISCLVNCVAPFIYMFLSKRFAYKKVLIIAIVLTGVSGFSMLALGTWTPALFLLTFIPYAMAEGIIRPLTFVVLLDQPEDRVGSASALVNFAYVIITAVATAIATFDFWPNFIIAIAAISAVVFVFCVLLYLWGLRETTEAAK